MSFFIHIVSNVSMSCVMSITWIFSGVVWPSLWSIFHGNTTGIKSSLMFLSTKITVWTTGRNRLRKSLRIKPASAGWLSQKLAVYIPKSELANFEYRSIKINGTVSIILLICFCFSNFNFIFTTCPVKCWISKFYLQNLKSSCNFSFQIFQ